MSENTIEAVLSAAQQATRTLRDATASDRRARMGAVADALEAAAGELIPLAEQESHLSVARLTGELARTTFQLRLYAAEAVAGRTLAAQVDEADPDWPTGPRPGLRRLRVAVGPVLVFAASNFPFAFSVAGTDTAAALAAGCPVVVKAHPGHPRLSRRVAEVARKALAEAGAPDGTLGLIEGEEAGRAALLDPRIRAAAFTGSLAGGRALFDLANSRPEPIPFYGELGSLNPAFVTPAAAAGRLDDVLSGFADSFTLGLGQFCTKPGVLFVPEGTGAEQILTGLLTGSPAGDLLNDHIADGHRRSRAALAGHREVRVVVPGTDDGLRAAPALLATTAAAVAADPQALLAEVFGPTAVLATYSGEDELMELAASLPGQLTATVQGEPDEPLTARLVSELADHAGRIVLNGWPTGVSVTAAMHHGGPYPATTAPLHTSVGTAAVDRFLRPVALQNLPDSAVPAAWLDPSAADSVTRSATQGKHR